MLLDSVLARSDLTFRIRSIDSKESFGFRAGARADNYVEHLVKLSYIDRCSIFEARWHEEGNK